jgi:hypothetical protein
MASDLLKGGNIFTAAAIGIGASILGPVILPAFRPIAKSLIKGGLLAFDQGRTAWAELNERTSDMIAEAREEMERVEAAPTPAPRKAAKKAAEVRPH